MTTVIVHRHLTRLEIVQLLPDGRLVLGRQPGPGFVSAAVVLVTRRHLNVVVEFDDLKRRTRF